MDGHEPHPIPDSSLPLILLSPSFQFTTPSPVSEWRLGRVLQCCEYMLKGLVRLRRFTGEQALGMEMHGFMMGSCPPCHSMLAPACPPSRVIPTSHWFLSAGPPYTHPPSPV